MAKKTQAYAVTTVDRETRYLVEWAVCEARTPEVMQAVVEAGPRAQNYFSDAFNTYRELFWWAGTRACMTSRRLTQSKE